MLARATTLDGSEAVLCRPWRRVLPQRSAIMVGALMLAASACGDAVEMKNSDRAGTGGPLIVYNAGSLAKPLRAALDSFAALKGVRIEQESAGSLETARKLTELNKIPDVIALADHEVFPQLLIPGHVTWYVQFARNRMVLAFTDKSRHASDITSDNWLDVIGRAGVEVGRADPTLDPNGYRTLLVWQLAEHHYLRPGLADTLLAGSPRRNVRSKETDLVALLQVGEFDYIWSYESIAQAAGLRYLILPKEIDLSEPAESASYARASVRIPGASQGDSVTFRGTPIVYGLSIPKDAPRPVIAEEFVSWLLSAEGRGVLKNAQLEALDGPRLVGDGASDVVRRAVAAAAARAPDTRSDTSRH